MITLYSNLSYSNVENEKFSLEKLAKPINFPEREVSTLPLHSKTIYDAFVDLIGYANVIITDIPGAPGDEEGYLFYRHFNFDHDERYNIIGHGNYSKRYIDLSSSEKMVVDSFVALLSSFS